MARNSKVPRPDAVRFFAGGDPLIDGSDFIDWILICLFAAICTVLAITLTL